MYPRIELSGWDDSASWEGGGSDPAAFSDIVVDGNFFASLRHATTFYIIRHGQTEGNASFTFQGRLDYPLDSKGLEQAGTAAAWLAEKQIDAIVSSPQKRASTTASIIAQACGLAEPIFLPSLVEVDVGLFTGVNIETARLEHPEVYKKFQYGSWDVVPGAEPSRSMYSRAVASWVKMRELAERGAKTIVCVAHGGVIQWLIRSTFGAKSWLPLMPTSNCGISQLDMEPTGEGDPAFIQWSMLNFKVPAMSQGVKQVF